MNRHYLFLISALLLFLAIGCSTGSDDLETNTEVTDEDGENTDTTVADADNCDDHEAATDYVWDSSSEITIVLNESSITTSNSSAVNISGSIATIIKAGNYRIDGTLSNGQIIVNSTDEATTRLILNGANITCSSSAPIDIENADKVIVVLADNTTNTLTDGSNYVFASADIDEPNAALYSKADMTIYGGGSLNVKGNYNDGITSKDGLIIKSGTVTVNAADDGIRGKDYLIVKDGNITVTSGGDGLKSDNDEDLTKGYISVLTGTIKVTSTGDAISAQKDVLITNGTITVISGGGSTKTVSESISTKGIKSVVGTIIDGGTININSCDDAIHSNKRVVINGGTYTISSGDDGIHADSTLTISGGDITISKSYEGIESAIITINDGTVHLTSIDDGLNVAGGADGSSTNGRPGQNTFTTSSSSTYLYMNGGYVYMNASGDGVDVNGSALMTGGTIIVNGPTDNGNGPMDYDGTFKITGGYLIAAGSSGMAQIPGSTSTQCSVLLKFNSSQKSGNMIHIQASDGSDVLSFVPTKTYQSIAFSSPLLVKGSSFDVYLGGSSSGSAKDGLYSGGNYTAGTKYTTFTQSSVALTK